jgi:hypothetical protein
MPRTRIEKISEGAYFIFEPSSFNGSIVPYDHIVANQTILSDGSAPFGVSQEDPQLTTSDPQYPLPWPE